MILWSIQLIIIYLLLIILVHYLYSFFKITLTIPKMKDLVNKPVERYNEIYTTINDSKKSSSITPDDNNNEMQNELKQFLESLHTNDTHTQINSHSLDNNEMYSNY